MADDQAAVTVFRARFLTMERAQPAASAVAVRGGRIVAVGTVVLPGFIEQYLHPMLGATTLMTDVAHPSGEHDPSASIGCGATAASLSALSSPASSPT